MKKFVSVCKIIFGYGILCTLFAGGMTLLGYIGAFVVGGELAADICEFVYKKCTPVIVYISNIMVLFGIFSMYLAGEYALSTKKNETLRGKK